jgi:ribose 5-phosphate isomerase A
MSRDREKQTAAEAAAEIPGDGMLVGLGTGTTVAFLLPALASRKLSISCVATSPETAEAAAALGLDVRPFDSFERLDIAIDGADQVARDGWLVKGGGGAHTREKIVAAASARFVVIVSENKLVDRLSPPVPLELSRFGLGATLRLLRSARARGTAESPDGGVIADWLGEIGDPAELAAWLSAQPGVVEHGLFPASMVSDVIVGTSSRGTRHLRFPGEEGGNR